MSPVHSTMALDSPIRRRRVSPTPESLFPECPDDLSPKQVAGNLAPVAGQRGTISDRTTPDCPPASPAKQRTPDRSHSPVRNFAADPSDRARARLVGIARLAAASPPAETRRKSAERPEYFVLPVKSILNRCDSERVPFEWTINPYRGCEFACKYCYARYTHEYMELDGGEFEKKIYVKKDAGPLLAWDVAHKYSYARAASGGTHAEHIAIGTATDPYQPAEREHGVTRACLEELAKREGLSVSIITKSDQIVRDIDVLQRIGERSNLAIDITITTLRTRLARMLEPRAPRPDLRLAAVKQLSEAGLAVGVSASPLIPGITDREGDLEAVAAAGKQAGAQWFFSGVLFLMPSSAKQFFPFLESKFPRLVQQYEKWFGRNVYAPEDYRKKVAERVARIRQTYGFRSGPRFENKHAMGCTQMSLEWDAAAAAKEMERTADTRGYS
ncbi:MAG: radical SAM protein [Acidobacteria bacterium]|nr:MAG: radical SAM protein [Acidobacteriota bacterium]